MADEAVCIGPAPARESYLTQRRDHRGGHARPAPTRSIRATASSRRTPDFAEACAAAGLVFVGPPAAAIRAMGSKSAAKALMEQAGVPLVPGYHGDDQRTPALAAAAAEIGYPVLIKAVGRRRRQGHAGRRARSRACRRAGPARSARRQAPSATTGC